MKIYVKLEPPYEWARVAGNSVEAFGEVFSLAEYPIGDEEEVIGVVPGEWVTTHSVKLPTKTRKQFNQALPFALEDSISEDVSNIHFVCPNWRAATQVTVMSVSKDKMAYWQALANDNRLPVFQLLPDHALVPFHEAAHCSIALSDDTVLARHADLGGVSIDSSLLEVWLMDVPIADTIAVNDQELAKQLIEEHPSRDFRHWPFGDRMRHWLEYEFESNLDLWADVYRPKVSRMGKSVLLKPALLLMLAVGAFFSYDVYRYFALHSEIGRLDQKMVNILGETVPGVQGVSGGDARRFLETAISRGQAKANEKSVHAALAEAATVLKRMRATLVEMTYQNEELVLTCVLNDFSQVDALTKQLNGRRSLSASLQGSAAEDDKVVATYSVRQTN